MDFTHVGISLLDWYILAGSYSSLKFHWGNFTLNIQIDLIKCWQNRDLYIDIWHCQYSWVSQQGNPRETLRTSSIGFQQGNPGNFLVQEKWQFLEFATFPGIGNPTILAVWRQSGIKIFLVHVVFPTFKTQACYACWLQLLIAHTLFLVFGKNP